MRNGMTALVTGASGGLGLEVSRLLAQVTIGTVEPMDYAQVSALEADVAALQDDVVGIDGNLSTAASVTVVESTVTTAIDDLGELADLDF